jgi:dTDP-4-amino-4,6-dideoxygalactose transaminase
MRNGYNYGYCQSARSICTIGHLAAYSFHETKNFTSGGEGGLLIINDERFINRAEIIREKGTNRSLFFRGMVDKYSWVDIGSSYLPSELQAAYLWGQLGCADSIIKNRLVTWEKYYSAFAELDSKGFCSRPSTPEECQHNGHMFYLKVEDVATRTALLTHLHEDDINAVFHYIPLHNSIAGKQFSRFNGVDNYTTKESDRLVRLPLWYGMQDFEIQEIIDSVWKFFIK